MRMTDVFDQKFEIKLKELSLYLERQIGTFFFYLRISYFIMHVKTLCEYNVMTLIYFCRFTYLLFYLFFCCPGALFYIIDGFLISQKISIFQNFLTLLALNIMKKILPSRAKKFFKSLC